MHIWLPCRQFEKILAGSCIEVDRVCHILDLQKRLDLLGTKKIEEMSCIRKNNRNMKKILIKRTHTYYYYCSVLLYSVLFRCSSVLPFCMGLHWFN